MDSNNDVIAFHRFVKLAGIIVRADLANKEHFPDPLGNLSFGHQGERTWEKWGFTDIGVVYTPSQKKNNNKSRVVFKNLMDKKKMSF